MKTLNVGPHVNPNWLSVSTGNIYRIVEVIDDEHIRVNRLNASQQPDCYVWHPSILDSSINCHPECAFVPDQSLYTIRPMATIPDSKDSKEVPFEKAEFFALFRYTKAQTVVEADPANSSLLTVHVQDGPTYADVHRFAVENELKLEPICDIKDVSLANT